MILAASGPLYGRPKPLAVDVEPFVVSLGEAAQLGGAVTAV